MPIPGRTRTLGSSKFSGQNFERPSAAEWMKQMKERKKEEMGRRKQKENAIREVGERIRFSAEHVAEFVEKSERMKDEVNALNTKMIPEIWKTLSDINKAGAGSDMLKQEIYLRTMELHGNEKLLAEGMNKGTKIPVKKMIEIVNLSRGYTERAIDYVNSMNKDGRYNELVEKLRGGLSKLNDIADSYITSLGGIVKLPMDKRTDELARELVNAGAGRLGNVTFEFGKKPNERPGAYYQRQGAITFSDNLPKGERENTIKHELAHTVFKDYLPEEKRKLYLLPKDQTAGLNEQFDKMSYRLKSKLREGIRERAISTREIREYFKNPLAALAAQDEAFAMRTTLESDAVRYPACRNDPEHLFGYVIAETAKILGKDEAWVARSDNRKLFLIVNNFLPYLRIPEGTEITMESMLRISREDAKREYNKVLEEIEKAKRGEGSSSIGRVIRYMRGWLPF